MSGLREEVLETAKSGDAVLLNEILMKLDCTKRISVLAAFERRNTPLILAVQNGNLDCVKVLLKYGADIEGRGYLIYLGEDDQRRVYRSCTPLFVAAAYGNVEILKFLVENGANVNTNNNHDSISPLMVAIKHQFTDAVSLLIDQGADVNSQDNSGKTALHCAIEQNFDALSCLITHGADINAVTNEKCTPLMIACKHNNDSVVNFLLENGADVALRDNNGETALHYVWNRSGSSAKILSSLIKYGVDINTRRNNPINETHLMNASHCSAVTTVSLLIEHGASVNLQDQCGNTALHYAVTEKSEETICALVNAGASHLCNGRELTPLLLACNDCYVTMVECLIKQPGMTKENKINALELLGASILIECVCKEEFDHGSDIEEGLMYIKRGMIERFSDPSDPLLKRQMEPVEAYQNRKESQTFEELVQRESDRDEDIIVESLLIRERILGRYHVELIQPIRDAANYFSCAEDFPSCVRLYRHAMKTAQGCDQLAVLDLRDISSELCNWLETAKRKGSIEEDFFEVLNQTILDLDHEMQRKKTYRQGWIGCLFYAVQELFFMISKVECAEGVKLSSLGLLLKTICNLDPRDSGGNTLLHKFAMDHGGVSSCSYTGAVKLLLSAGLNVNATNGNGDTPLHIVATLKPGEDNIHLLTDMLQVLFDGGAHHDFVNKNGKTPIDLAETNEAVMIISDQSKLELLCISARAVRKFGIPYLGIVPKTLEKYINRH